MAGGAGDRSELLLRTGNGKFARLLRLQEVADAETGPGIPFVATNHMHMGMEDVLAAGGSDTPSDRKTVRLELIKPAFCLRKHFTEVGPFLRAELEWCLDMTDGMIIADGFGKAGFSIMYCERLLAAGSPPAKPFARH